MSRIDGELAVYPQTSPELLSRDNRFRTAGASYTASCPLSKKLGAPTIPAVNDTLTSSGTVNPEIVSSRLLPFPVEAVYQASADPGALAVWWGPEGFTNSIETFDLRPGGMWSFVMYGPDGVAYPMAKRFIEVVPQERIVLLHLEPPQHRFKMSMEFSEAPQGTHLTWRMLFELAEEADRVREVILQANEENFDRLTQHLLNSSGRTPRERAFG